MNISLIKADLQDCEEIHKMQVLAFKPLLDKYQDYETNPGAETIEHIQQRMEYPSLTHFFIRLQSKNIGHIRISQHDATTCRLGQMCILPEYQGNGYAQQAIKLVETLYPMAKRWELDTIKQEQKLCHLYEKMGYKPTGEEKNIKAGMDLIYYAK